MRTLFLALMAVLPFFAADELKPPLVAAADADFERVVNAPAPDMAASAKCVQSQAMLFAVATPEEVARVVFRKAYCELAHAEATHNRAAFEPAAEEFDDAIADAQSAYTRQKLPHNATPVGPDVPSTWRILNAVARLNAGASPESQERTLALGVDEAAVASEPLNPASCQSNGAAMEFCRSVKQLGSAWLGWMALERGDRVVAARRFKEGNVPEWSDWVSGLDAFRAGNYVDAASKEGRAIAEWRKTPPQSLQQRLGPQPSMPMMLTEWAGAQLAAGDSNTALANLDAALRSDPAIGRALYLRAVAKQRLRRNEAAMDDYNLASRAAFSKPGDAAAAEAHFYRGIALYWRKEFVHSEDEFATALNGDPVASWLPDARAWRHMAAVAGGACGSSRESLTRELAAVSPYFPKAEAAAVTAACPLTAAVLPIRPAGRER
jgi:tetratricopeptide (TPR) repeat protein